IQRPTNLASGLGFFAGGAGGSPAADKATASVVKAISRSLARDMILPPVGKFWHTWFHPPDEASGWTNCSRPSQQSGELGRAQPLLLIEVEVAAVADLEDGGLLADVLDALVLVVEVHVDIQLTA